MSDRVCVSLSSVAAIALTAMLIPAPAAGQGGSGAKGWKPSRTPDGQPDIQGVWSYATLTPLERPDELAAKDTFSDEEAAEFARRTVERVTSDRRDGGAEADVGRSYNEFWRERGTVKAGRTSLIFDPPDGKVPPLTPAGQKRLAESNAVRARPATGPEDRNTWERCLTRGLPMLPSSYNNNFQVVQIPGYVVMFIEMVHDARVIPLDGRPHLAPHIRSWLGDARGRWEGDTLVVDTTNFNGKAIFRGSGEGLHLIERFTPVGPDTLHYEFRVEDPSTFTRPWSAMLPLAKLEGPLFEYACHEGNYALVDILAGARADERKAAEAASKGGSR
jgi:hypothetical protein